MWNIIKALRITRSIQPHGTINTLVNTVYDFERIVARKRDKYHAFSVCLIACFRTIGRHKRVASVSIKSKVVNDFGMCVVILGRFCQKLRRNINTKERARIGRRAIFRSSVKFLVVVVTHLARS